MARRSGGIVNRVLEEVESRTGVAVERRERIALLEARSEELSATVRDLDLIGWSVLDYMSRNPQEMSPQARRHWVQQIRNVWLQDPQAGAAVDLMNDFVFGRGVPKPRAKDDAVQEVIDEFWDDPDNQLVLTGYGAQMALGTDLSLQCNLFLLIFPDDTSGKLKVGLLNHDEVENVVRDSDFRQRILFYVAAHKSTGEWDFQNDAPKLELNQENLTKKTYYEHWRNLTVAKEENSKKLPNPPKDKLGDGKVYPVAINRTSEQAFGNPSMRRLLRWFSAYNSFLAARVDMAEASAAFIMRRKVKGTPSQVERLASKAISRQSEIAGLTGVGVQGLPQAPPRGGSILSENEQVNHEPFTLNSNSASAQGDAQMIRANISAGTRWPQAYFGDASQSNLATSTSLELPILKLCETRQEVFEGLYRDLVDLAIQTAVDSGKLDKYVEPTDQEGAGSADQKFFDFGDTQEENTGAYGPPSLDINQGFDDQNQDEQRTQRDLSYEFSMPSPLRRMMTDLVTAITSIAKTFDPNATNMELSRVLLAIALGEGLEVQDPADAVKAIFPDNYEDPAVVAAQAAAQPQPPPGPQPGDNSAENADQGNPYSAPGFSAQYQNNQGQIQQAAITRGRDGAPVMWPGRTSDERELLERYVERRIAEVRERALTEAALQEELSPSAQTAAAEGADDAERIFREEMDAVLSQRLNGGS